MALISELKSVKIIKHKIKNSGDTVLLNQIQKYKNDTEIYVNGKESVIYARTLIANESYIMKIFEEEIL